MCLSVSGSGSDGQNGSYNTISVPAFAGFLCSGAFTDDVEGISDTDVGMEADVAHIVSDGHGAPHVGVGGGICGGKYIDLCSDVEPVKADGVLCLDVVGGVFGAFSVWREFFVLPAPVGNACCCDGSVCVDRGQSRASVLGACIDLADADTSLCVSACRSGGRGILSCADVLFCYRKRIVKNRFGRFRVMYKSSVCA